MTNLLADPNNWGDPWNDPPTVYWDGTKYESLSGQNSEGLFYLTLEVEVQEGSYVSGKVNFTNWTYNGIPNPGYLNLKAGGEVINSIELSTSSTTEFHFDIPIGSSDVALYLTNWKQGINPSNYYGLDIDITPLAGLVANDDEATTISGVPVSISVLDNDTYGESPVSLDQLEGPPTIHSPPVVGQATVNPDGTITYTPPVGFVGEVEFQYRIALPEPEPEELTMCVVLGEDFLITTMPGDFNLHDVVSIEDQYGNWMALRYFSWAGGWGQSYGDYFYLQPGESYNLSQDDILIENVGVRDGFIILTIGDYWYFGFGAYPWVNEFTVANESGTFTGYRDSGSEIIWADPGPPVPTAGTSYPIVLTYMEDGREQTFCGAIAFETD